MKTFAIFLLILFAGMILAAVPASAFDDGFGAAQLVQGQSHVIYFHEVGTSLSVLIKQFHISTSDEWLAGTRVSGTDRQKLAAMIDTLYSGVCDALDMHPDSYRGTIKICRDQAELQKIYLGLFGRSLPSTANAFFVQDGNIIYVTPAGFTVSIMSHEIAHAVIGIYYKVLPPDKQEVLASQVEYQICGGIPPGTVSGESSALGESQENAPVEVTFEFGSRE